MRAITESGRCVYVCTDETIVRRPRGDGWRCGQIAGHLGSHILYSADGERVLLNAYGAWKQPEPAEETSKPGITREDLEEFFTEHQVGHVFFHGEGHPMTDDTITDLLSLIQEKTQ